MKKIIEEMKIINENNESNEVEEMKNVKENEEENGSNVCSNVFLSTMKNSRRKIVKWYGSMKIM